LNAAFQIHDLFPEARHSLQRRIFGVFEKTLAKAFDLLKRPVIFTARPKEGGSEKPATVQGELDL